MKPKIFHIARTILLASSLSLQLCALNAAASESVSELLEKAIFAEETKGDVDSAIGIYQKVIAEGAASQKLAAEAQFRLAQCYLKKNMETDAVAAFRKVIHDFPNEKELVAKAREHLPSDLVFGQVPWVDGERLQYKALLANGREAGTLAYRADRVKVNGRDVWRVGGRLSVMLQAVSRVDVDAETFAPISSVWKHSILGEISMTYLPGEIDVLQKGKTQPSVMKVDGFVLDNEETMHAIRRLPLQEGYKATLPINSGFGSAAISLEVTGREKVKVPVGEFDCFKVVLQPISQTFWFSADAHRYLVKFETAAVSANLISIAQRKAGEPVSYNNAELGLSFTTPADWLIFQFKEGQPGGQQLIRTFDADADTTDGGLRLFPTDKLSANARQSAHAWAQEQVKQEKTIKVRPNGWIDYNVAGRPGVGVIADFTEGNKSQTQLCVYSLGARYSELFVITAPTEKFDALKAAFDTVIASYRIQ